MLKKIIRKILFWARLDEFDKHGVHHTSTVHHCRIIQPSKINKNCYLLNCSIGRNTYFASDCVAMNATIGSFCSFGKNVAIGPGMHPTHTYVSTSPYFWSPLKQTGASLTDKPLFQETGTVQIGNDVWIGQNAIVMDNITIGDGAIVAAGAVVTKDVPAYAIVGGIPAKLIKMRFAPEEISFLEELKWWDKDEKWYRDNIQEMCNIRELMQKHQTAHVF